MAQARKATVRFAQPDTLLEDVVLGHSTRSIQSSERAAINEHVREVHAMITPLLNWEIDARINRAGRELLESLGVQDTSTDRLIAAAQANAQRPQGGAASIEATVAPSAAWDAQSGRTAMLQFLLTVWNTLTHPLTVSLAVLFLSSRAIIRMLRRKALRTRNRSDEHSRSDGRGKARRWTRRRHTR